MHATIQKPLDEILANIAEGEKVFVVGCGNCAAKCHTGGEKETKHMKERLEEKGVTVTGWAVPPNNGSLCKLSATIQLLRETHKKETDQADSFLVLSCGQGVHTVLDATEGAIVHPGCDTIFGGETVADDYITEFCSLCGQCVVEQTGGLCPVTLCAKSLLNGPCGGAKDGKCEVFKERDCGWHLIYNRLKELGRLDLLEKYQPPKDFSRSATPRHIRIDGNRVTFSFGPKSITVES